MDIVEEIKIAIGRKGLTMEEAAKALDMSRTTLYGKIATAEKDKDFQLLLEERLGINIHNPTRNSLAIAVPERVIDNVAMKYNIVPLKNKRIAEVWLPADFDNADVKTFVKWLELKESTL